MNIAVIGGGIGGLAVARALQQRGAEVTVLEQAEAITEVGAGLQVSPNGFCVLEALGLGAALRDNAVRGEAVRLCDYRGADIARMDLAGLENPNYFFVHRADLIDLLAEGARGAGVRIRLLQKVDRIETGAPAVVRIANGDKMQADLVIGADGLHSVARRLLNGTVAPFFTQQVAWRAVVPNTEGRGPEARVFMGPHRHLVSYPLRGGRALNIVAVQERGTWSEESWSQEDHPDNLRAAFADFCPEVQRMLAQVQKTHLWGLFRHAVAQRWHGEGLVLLGDAAHPTLPFMAQGACLALEDAWVLADTLDGDGTLSERLAAYQARRQPRTRAVVDAANGNAWKYHLSWPPVRMAAHSILRIGNRLAPDRLLRRFDWIYGHDVVDEDHAKRDLL